MKKFVKHILITTFILFLYSCEDVVDIPLDNATPKLVIDANIKWQKGTVGENQTIKLSLTNDFYSNEIAIASGAIVRVTDSDANVFDFYQMSNSPDYVCDNFIPVVNKNYTLTVLYKGETYTATNKLMATPTIDTIEQETVPGFDGEDSIQIKFFFQDNGAEDNFYLVGAKNPLLSVKEFGVISDEFFQGNRMFGFYTNEKLDRGSTLKFSLQGITSSYYNYMNKLIAMSSSNAGNPFATPTSTLRGNILNRSNPENYPLGYFSLTEIDTREYLVQ